MEFVFDLMSNMVLYAMLCGICNNRIKFRAKGNVESNN